jgi:hypothetical protein
LDRFAQEGRGPSGREAKAEFDGSVEFGFEPSVESRRGIGL